MGNLIDTPFVLGNSKTLKIGTVVVNRPVVLAPMAGVTDRSYRRIMAQHGAGLVTTEMISAEGLVRRNPNTLSMLVPDASLQAPLAVQLFGARPQSIAEAARMVEQSGAAIIDINAGCPVRKVARQGAGAALLSQLGLLCRLVEAARNSVTVPVTIKLRLGWSKSSINLLETAKQVVDAGVDAITLHARTAVQGYSGQADWSWIRQLKEAVSVPVIGNGDVTHPVLVQRMAAYTGCDAVMIGRASLGNPWIFGAHSTTSHFASQPHHPVDWEDFLAALQLHVEELQLDRPNLSAGTLRKVMGWYLNGCPGAARLRQQLMGESSWMKMLELCRSAVTEWQARGLSFCSVKFGPFTGHEICPRPVAASDYIPRGRQAGNCLVDVSVC